ncbi:MAG: hypothetical protein V3V62_01940 [bacterium]
MRRMKVAVAVVGLVALLGLARSPASGEEAPWTDVGMGFKVRDIQVGLGKVHYYVLGKVKNESVKNYDMVVLHISFFGEKRKLLQEFDITINSLARGATAKFRNKVFKSTGKSVKSYKIRFTMGF